MKFGNRDKSVLLCLGIIIFVLSATAIIHAKVIEDANVEVVYLFDEGEGDVAIDSSPNGRDGTIIGAQLENKWLRRFWVRVLNSTKNV